MSGKFSKEDSDVKNRSDRQNKKRSRGFRAIPFVLALGVSFGVSFGALSAAEPPVRPQNTFFRFTAEETSRIPGWPESNPDSVSEAVQPASEPEPLRTANIESTAFQSGSRPENGIRPVSISMEKPELPLSDSSDALSGESFDFELEVGAETLEDAWRIALDESRKLQSKDYEQSKAESDVRAALGVGLPKISNASGRHTLSEDLAIESTVSLQGIMPGGGSLPVETTICDRDFTTSITALTIPLYMGGRVRGMIEGANSVASAVAAGKQIDRLDLKYEVARTYFLVFRVRKLLEVAVEAERTIAAHEKDARRLQENGLVTKNVVLAAQVALANARQDVIKAQNALALTEAAYNRLLWRPLDSPVNISDIPLPALSGDLDSLTAAALHGRPELTALAHKSQALAAQSKVHRADRLPQVALVGTHNYLENSHLNAESSFSGTVGMVWMPIDGGVSRARQEASCYEAMSVTKQYEDARSGIELQVYQCWLDERESRGRVEVAQKAVEQADENLRVVTRGFQEGLVNHSEVLDATTLRTEAWTNLAHARYDAILTTYHLRRAVGDL